VPRSVPPWGELGRLLGAAERWLLPGACLLCGDPSERAGTGAADPLVCGPCRLGFPRLPYPRCARCGQPLAPGIGCRLCSAWPAGLGGVQSAVWLDAGARRAVHLLKYEGWWRLAEVMAEVMATSLEWRGEPTLVPIPLSTARARRRGYNQSAVLAQALGQRLGFRVHPALVRTRDTGTQTVLTPEARRANLAGAFGARGHPPIHPVLVDDVFTTGATLAEAGHALLEAGAATVEAVTFARAMRPLADAVNPAPSR
jgi:ComF family protein